jgi:hypothetical protein
LPAAIELALTVPAGITLSSVSIGPAATAAGKELSMNGGQLIEFGLNQTVIGQGVVAIAHLSIPAATTKALYSIGLTNPVVSDASGKAVIVSATSGVVVVN